MKIKISSNCLMRQEKRWAKLKTRKQQIAVDLQEGQQKYNASLEHKFCVQPSPQLLNVKGKSTFVKVEKKQRKMRAKIRLLRRANKSDYQHSGTFQEAIGPVLLLAQIFALMPIRGITSKSVQDLKFSWCHVRTIYSLVVLLSFGIYSGFTIAYAFRGNFNYDAGETIIFNMSVFLISSAFLSLARKWPALIVQWESIELKVPLRNDVRVKSKLSYRIKMITLVATMCSLMEHLLNMLSIIYYVNACPSIPGQPIESFLKATFAQFFYFFDYNNIAGVIGKIFNVLSTFTWNFNDIFIMAVSVGLAMRFRQLNEHMMRAVNHRTSPEFWLQCRVNYRNLRNLCDLVDSDISWITFLCFSNNLYFICSKILKSLQKKPSFTHTVYFWFSLGYLLGRTLLLSLYTADIHEESKRPLKIFRSISLRDWNSELKRFADEVSNDEVALSGLKFFRLTRSAVLSNLRESVAEPKTKRSKVVAKQRCSHRPLWKFITFLILCLMPIPSSILMKITYNKTSIAGTIVTYELVLLQFNKNDTIHDCNEF